LAKDFARGAPVIVTYHERGNEISRYAPDFDSDLANLGELRLRYLKLSIQEPEAYGINRLAAVELNASGKNEVRVQGVQESWVIGKAEALAVQLRPKEKFFATTFRKFGPNFILLVLALAALPEISFPRRLVFLTFVGLVSEAVSWLHVRYIPNALISLSNKDPGWMERAWPQILSWVIAATSGLVALIGYGLLRGELGTGWFSAWIH
jgi:hypothetical protein